MCYQGCIFELIMMIMISWNYIITEIFMDAEKGTLELMLLCFPISRRYQAEIVLPKLYYFIAWVIVELSYMYLDWDKQCGLRLIYVVFGTSDKYRGDAIEIFKILDMIMIIHWVIMMFMLTENIR